MIEYLQTLLRSGDAFLLHVHLQKGTLLSQRGLFAADEHGLMIDSNKAAIDRVLIPWTAVDYVSVEVTG